MNKAQGDANAPDRENKKQNKLIKRCKLPCELVFLELNNLYAAAFAAVLFNDDLFVDTVFQLVYMRNDTDKPVVCGGKLVEYLKRKVK